MQTALVHADHLHIFVTFVDIIPHFVVNPIVKFFVTQILFKIVCFKLIVQCPQSINAIQIRRSIQE